MTRSLRTLAAAVAIIASVPCSAQTPVFGGHGVPAWSRLYYYMQHRLGQVAGNETVLILPAATNAAWDDPIEVVRLMEMHKWGDWMPSHAWQYSANASKRVSEGYQYFLSAAFVAAVDANGTITSDVKNALKRANEALVFARSLYNEKVREADEAYDRYSAETSPFRRKSKVDFFRDQGYDAEIEARRGTLDSARETLKIVTSGIVDPDIQLLTNAKIRFDNPKQRIMLPPVREALNDPDRWQSSYVSFLDKDIFAFLREEVPEGQSITESSSRSESFEQRWSASVSVSFLGLFRAGGASAEQVKREQHLRSNVTRIDISFDNVDAFNIVRGEWFDENVIARFAPKLKTEAFTAVWGPGGQLELIPKTLLVGRGMVARIYADSQSLDYLYEHTSGGIDGGFSIGWWRIGGGAGYSSTREETEVKRYNDRIEIRDLSGRAKVLGVLAKHLASTLPKPTMATAPSEPQRAAARTEIEALWKASAPLLKGVSARTLKAVTQ